MLAPLALLDQLQARLDEMIGPIAAGAGTGFASLVLELPNALTLPPELAGPRFSLTHARRGELRVGYGVAAEWRGAGPERFTQLRTRARTLTGDWNHWDPDETGFKGFALLGFAADPMPQTDPLRRSTPNGRLPNALLWVPELALSSTRGQSALILTAALPATPSELRARWRAWLARLVPALAAPLPEPLTPGRLQPLGSVPEYKQWRGMVEATLNEIECGRLHKAVLCRHLSLMGRRPFDLGRLQAALTWLFPACQVIRIAHHGASFVAATPERLLTVRDGAVEVDALAGTAARSASAEQDAVLTNDLRDSEKDRREHALVVDAVRASLDPCCTDIRCPDLPRVMQLHNAQHLWSPIQARLNPGTDLLELAERLHPTPATNGTPRREAREWLRRAEPIERGWYTGAAGILEPDLSGELWVLLRCAEVSGKRARLYAGAGIVAGSDPLTEWRETAHKLSAMASALRFA